MNVNGETLDKRIYNSLREDIKKLNFLSSGFKATGFTVENDLNQINKKLKYLKEDSFVLSQTKDSSDNLIDGFTPNSFYTRYKNEYGFSVKNHFSLGDCVNTLSNSIEVDLASTESINIQEVSDNQRLTIDGVVVEEGNTILLKDQSSSITLDEDINPEEFFLGEFSVEEVLGSNITYNFKNSQNGIYTYKEGKLVESDELNNYEFNNGLSVSIRIGIENKGKTFTLERLNSGVFPLKGRDDPFFFKENDNYLIRNVFQYRNVLDNQFYGGLFSQKQSLRTSKEVFEIPERYIFIGDFGTIINYQSNYPNIIKNKFKESLKDIIELKNNYLIVGDNGTILQLDKIELTTSKVQSNTFQNLNSVSFLDNQKGVVVGDNGTILYTLDGRDFKEIENDIRNDLNKVSHKEGNIFEIVGNNGVIFSLDIDSLKLISKEISYVKNFEDKFPVKGDIFDFEPFKINKKRFKYSGDDWVDVNKNIGSGNFSIDFVFKLDNSNGDKQILLSFLTEKYPNTTGITQDKGIKIFLEDNLIKLQLNSQNKSKILTLNTKFIVEKNKWYSVFLTRNKNKYFLYVDSRLVISTEDGFGGNFSDFNDRIRLGAELSYNDNDLTYSSESKNYFSGVIDNLRIWNEYLDKLQVEEYFNFYKLSSYQKDKLLGEGLVNFYRFSLNSENKLPLSDTIKENSLLLPSGSNYENYNNTIDDSLLDIENYSGDIVLSDNLVIIRINEIENYSNSVNYEFVFQTTINLDKVEVSEDNFYISSEKGIFKLPKNDIRLDLNDLSNFSEIKLDKILDTSYNNLLLTQGEMFLIGKSKTNEIDSISLEDIPKKDDYNPLEGVSPFLSLDKIRRKNGLEIRNQYRNDFTEIEYKNRVKYTKTLGIDESNQSLVKIPLEKNGFFIPIYTPFYVSLEVDKLFNGSIEISLNGKDFFEISNNGKYLFRGVVGSKSEMTIRARLSDSPYGNRIRGDIFNIELYQANTINIKPPKKYTEGDEITKLYFSQFDTQDRLQKLNKEDHLYSYLDIKSLEIDSTEKINFSVYDNQLPKYLFRDDIKQEATSNCLVGNLCKPDPRGGTLDRIRYGFNLKLNNNLDTYVYEDDSYGLLEEFNLDGVQIFGLDKSQITSPSSTLKSPFFLGINLNKSFSLEVESFIINKEDLSFKDITNGNSENQNVVIFDNEILYPQLDDGLFNKVEFSELESSFNYQINCNLEKGKVYRLEFLLEGKVRFKFGGKTFDFNSQSTNKIRETIRIDDDLTSFSIENIIPEVVVRNLVLTESVPSKSKISWEPSICNFEYLINGNPQDEGFLLEDGSGRINPNCEFESKNEIRDTIKQILPRSYWSGFSPKLLFLNYDIASKLYFFDFNTKQYQLPSEVKFQDVNKIDISSHSGEVSWLDFSKDVNKKFRYNTPRTNQNEVKYSSIFRKKLKESFSVNLNQISTKDLSKINGQIKGILPHLDDNLSVVGIPNQQNNTEFFFYEEFMVFIKPTNFEVEIGDILKIKNSVVNETCLVIDKLSDGNTNLVYTRPNFSGKIVNVLLSLNKPTKITNLNLFTNVSSLEENFNSHPIKDGYELKIENSFVIVKPKLTEKSLYYNLQFRLTKEDSLLDKEVFKSNYKQNFLNFRYTPYYSLLNYLEGFGKDFTLRSFPEYTFENNNNGVLYDIQRGTLSFNPVLENKWNSIPTNVFLDLQFENITLKEVLVLNKFYDEKSDRYVITTYNNFTNELVQSDLSGSEFTLRVRNTLEEVSSDLQKLNNIHKSLEENIEITDPFNKNFFKSDVYKKGINFSPNLDNYAKAILSEGEMKKYLSGLVFTDHNNSLSFSVLNIQNNIKKSVNSIGKFPVDCENCEYQPAIKFINQGVEYNQIRYIKNDELYSKREPFSKYGFLNQIRLENTTGTTKEFDIPFNAENGTTKTFEFNVKNLENGTIRILKSQSVIYTISTIPNEKTKVKFFDDGNNDLKLEVEYSSEDNYIVIEDLRVGNEECFKDCNLTKLQINNHGLEGFQTEGIILDLQDDIFELDTLYKSYFELTKTEDTLEVATQSGWFLNGSEVGLSDGRIDFNYFDGDQLILDTELQTDPLDTHRIEFDFKLSSTFSNSVSILVGETKSSLNETIETLNPNGSFETIKTNFITNSNEAYIGLKFNGEGNIKINNIKIHKLKNRGKYLDGYNIIEKVIDEDNIVIDKEFIGEIEELTETFVSINKCGDEKINERTISDLGEMTKVIFDPYLNYAPIDLYELKINSSPDRAIQISTNDWSLNSNDTISLKEDFDKENYRYRLVDGLSVFELNNKFNWILNSDIREAVIGKEDNRIVWYKGIFDNGRFFDGKWLSGVFRDGLMINTDWFNTSVDEKNGEFEITNNRPNKTESVFYNGEFDGGNWNGGEFLGGEILDSIWEDGIFIGDKATNITWKGGEFLKGDFIDGTFNDGVFSARFGKSNFLSGEFLGGEFQNGVFFDGRFESLNKRASFGTNPNLTRKAIWENGLFIDGVFNSGDNKKNNLSIWKLGKSNGGFFRGGEIYGGEINNTSITNTEVYDIDVLAFFGSLTNDSFFTLKGEWNFKIGDEFIIIDNDIFNPSFGSNTNPIKYEVKRDGIIQNGTTRVVVEKLPQSLINSFGSNNEIAFGFKNNLLPKVDEIQGETILKIVPFLKQVNWFNGRFNNGLFSGNFRSGVFKGGVFSSGNFGF